MLSPSSQLTALLFTPGSRPERFAKAAGSGSDGIIVDLEDAVPMMDKDRVRDEVAKYFNANIRVGMPPFVSAIRVNSLRSDAGREDLMALKKGRVVPDVVVLPKVESADEVKFAVAHLDPSVKLVCLIETVQGVRRCASIAEASPSIAALAFGGYDLSAETGGEPSWEALLWPRTQMLHACTAAGIVALDQPYIDLENSAGLEAECVRVRGLGYVGKLAIHPQQIATIKAAFLPTAAQIERATRIVSAHDAAKGNVANIGGQMIDVPMYRSAQRILQRAGQPMPP